MELTHKTVVDQSNSEKALKEFQKSNRLTMIILCLVGLLVLTFSLVRLPFTGCFLDDVFFEYLFGVSKYFVYAFIYVILFCLMFKIDVHKYFFNVNSIVIEVLSLLFVCILTSAISWLVGNHSDVTKDFFAPIETYQTQFFHYLTKFNNKTWFTEFINVYQTGGLIGEFCVAISFTMQWTTLFILEAILLLLIIFLLFAFKDVKLFSKFKEWLIVKLGGKYEKNETNYDELNVDKKDKKIESQKTSLIKIEARKEEQVTPPLSFLTDSGSDYYHKNKERINKSLKAIKKLFEEKEIKLPLKSLKVMPAFSELTFKVTSDECVRKLMFFKTELLDALKSDSLEFFIKKDELVIEIKNKYVSKVSMKEVLISNKTNSNIAVVGATYNDQTITYDFNKGPMVYITGKQGSGAVMQICSLILSSLYLNTPDKLNLILCSPSEEKVFDSYASLPHLQCPPLTSLNETINKFLMLNETINERIAFFEKTKTKNLDEYNKTQMSGKLPYIMVVLFNAEAFAKSSNNNRDILFKLLSDDAKRSGIRVILYTPNSDNDTYNTDIPEYIDSFFVFKTIDEVTSRFFLNSSMANKLLGNGDGFLLQKSDHSKMRIQCCYINKEELSKTVKLISSFYKYKDREA